MEKVNPLQSIEEFVRTLAACEQGAGVNQDERILRGDITTPMAIFWNPLAELILLVVRICSRLFWGLRIDHAERLIPGNRIIAANHQSNLDVLWLLGALPYRLRKTLFITGKKELSLLKYLFIGSPIVFVDRTGNVLPSLKAAADILRSGAALIIFPEGTRTRDGSLGKFKSGAAYLAHHLGREIIPVTIRGAFGILPKGKILPRLFVKEEGRLIVGEPIDPRRFASIESLNDHVRDVIAGQTD
jgi:1-acyl-sn-glycerol-3-phosphate acyltransferase